ncbi:p-type ATPase [Blastocystis sp. subtype 4]|uniref:p-type ATPase n=1 Tax=Blastocystis sp. subtype 4 TaxID=944170 RepID=UPI0007112AEB|nr:p-type ATPase [Blastocystis sp. subtype 4]KNB44016.1 p-type ATPase [Blastocystis sp. subtype 4]|eukprot:XP_014527459.1 p-type ATPase [Blastocystis sp. subtype 4]
MEGKGSFRNSFCHIRVNHVNHGFGTNTVRNTKYRWWSFIFVNLFEQCCRLTMIQTTFKCIFCVRSLLRSEIWNWKVIR